MFEPGLAAESVKKARVQAKKWAIHINSNAIIHEAISRICRAGVDSERVSLNSVLKERLISCIALKKLLLQIPAL